MADTSDQYLNPLAKQAEEVIDEDTDWVTLAKHLDVTRYKYSDTYPEWHTSSPFRPMFLAYLWATVEQESLTGIPERLEKDPELARAFGFDPHDLPSPSTFKPVRITKRFSELETTVTLAAKQIRNIAAECGAPIGYQLAHTHKDVVAGDSVPSKRTINRMLRRKGKEVLNELKATAFPAIPLPRPDKPVYSKDELLSLEAIASIGGSAANGAGESMGDLKNPDPELDDPFYEDGPSGETLLDSIKEMSVDEIAKVMNFALQKTYTRAKPRLHQLDNFDTHVMLAIDITYVAYYGDRDEMEWVMGAPDDKEFDWCHMFATATIVGQNTHYTVGVLPLGSMEYADNEAYPSAKAQHFYAGDVVRQLVSIVNEFVDIRIVYADRAFHAVDVIHAFEEHDLFYLIPARKNDRIARLCKRFHSIKKGLEDDERDEPMYVQNDFAMHGKVKHGVSNARVTTNLVILSPDEDDTIHNPSSPRPFVTNVEVSDEIGLDRRETKKKVERYSNRAAIEKSYTSIKECAAWTTSPNYEVRWFHFAFGCIVYNMWLLVDFLTQERIGVIETRRKPRITLKRFMRWLETELIALI